MSKKNDSQLRRLRIFLWLVIGFLFISLGSCTYFSVKGNIIYGNIPHVKLVPNPAPTLEVVYPEPCKVQGQLNSQFADVAFDKVGASNAEPVNPDQVVHDTLQLSGRYVAVTLHLAVSKPFIKKSGIGCLQVLGQWGSAKEPVLMAAIDVKSHSSKFIEQFVAKVVLDLHRPVLERTNAIQAEVPPNTSVKLTAQLSDASGTFYTTASSFTFIHL